MFADARNVPKDTAVETDVCIIGGGAAGITLAREFSGSPFRVIVLESGDFEYDPSTQALYAGPSVGPQTYDPLDGPRLRYFGGTTNHWGGICRPFEPEDFEPRENIRYSGWPIRKADIAAFYGPATRVVGLSSDQFDLSYWAERDGSSPLELADDRIVNRVTLNVPDDVRSFGERFRRELERSRNVTVHLRANVMSIETDDAGATVASVRVATLSGNRFQVNAKLFILATGAIENARLLLASRSRFPNGLGNQNDVVGRFFAEHPRFIGGVLIPSNPYPGIKFYELHKVEGSVLRGYLGTSKQFQLDEGFLDLQWRPEPIYDPRVDSVLTSPSVSSAKRIVRDGRRGRIPPDFVRHVSRVMTDMMTWQRYVIPGAPVPMPYPEVLARLLRSDRREFDNLLPELLGDVAGRVYTERVRAPVNQVTLTTRIEQAPNPDSRVHLIADRDSLGMQRVALDWRLSEIDRRNARRSLELLGADVGAAGIGRLRILLDADDDTWPADLGGGSHHMGTTRMSTNPKEGVVDRNLRVHGMSNLFIGGSSVYPTAGGGTPTLTLVALALRLAGHVKEVLKR
jgi:choline dehydrogenase-like flavoprotein